MRFHSLHDPIDIVKVLPYKSTDSWVLCYRLVSSVGGLVTGLGSFNRYIIDEQGRNVRYFVSKYEGNIAVHNLWCVCISHGTLVSLFAPRGVWNVVRSRDRSARVRWSNDTNRSSIA